MSDPLCDRFPSGQRITVYDRLGKAVASSANLRGVLTYAAHSPVNVVAIRALAAGYYGVAFYFADGAECFTRWADWRIVLGWLKVRRSWSIERLTFGAEMPAPWAGELQDRTATIRKAGTIVTQHRYSDTPIDA